MNIACNVVHVRIPERSLNDIVDPLEETITVKSGDSEFTFNLIRQSIY